MNRQLFSLVLLAGQPDNGACCWSSVIDDDHASVATHTRAEEIAAEAKDFLELFERWIAANHPKLGR